MCCEVDGREKEGERQKKRVWKRSVTSDLLDLFNYSKAGELDPDFLSKN